MSGRDCLAHASFAACLPAERALIGCCSMDGKGAWRDNVFVERFWRTINYEEVYLRAYDGVEEARQSIGRYIAFYNAGDLTPPLTAAPRIKPSLTRCRSARQHNPGPTIHLTTRRFCSKDRGHFTAFRATVNAARIASGRATVIGSRHPIRPSHPAPPHRRRRLLME